jgi:hypothetical protein
MNEEDRMLNKFLVVALALLPAVAAAQQKMPVTAGAPSVSAVLQQQLSRVENDALPMANEMPEAKFNFVPSNGEFAGVRSFAGQAKMLARQNYRIGGFIAGEKPPVALDVVENAKTKAEIVKLLGDSFAYAHKALGTITEKNMVEPMPSPFGAGQATRLGLAVALIADLRDHYGQMVVYFRMNGMVPPASRRK